MDLGFGNANQIVGDVAARALLQSARAQESVLDDQLAQYDAALRTNPDNNHTSILDQLRAKRLKELQQAHIEQQQWQAAGHGTYRELEASPQHAGDVTKAFFDMTKESDRVVLHFYVRAIFYLFTLCMLTFGLVGWLFFFEKNLTCLEPLPPKQKKSTYLLTHPITHTHTHNIKRPTSPYCDSVHAHLNQLATKHVETRFCKLNVDGCENSSKSGSGAAFLVQHFGIQILPTLVLIQQRRVVHQMRGLNEVLQVQLQMQQERGGSSHRRPLGRTKNEMEPSVAALERVLLQHGVIRGPPVFEEEENGNNDDDDIDDDMKEFHGKPTMTVMMRRSNQHRSSRGAQETDDFD